MSIMRSSPSDKELSWSFEEHRRRQIRRGLDLTPAERLRWLEESVAELRGLLDQSRFGLGLELGHVVELESE